MSGARTPLARGAITTAILALVFLCLGGSAPAQERFRWRPLVIEDFGAPVPTPGTRVERAEVQLLIEKRISLRLETDGRITVREAEFEAFFDPSRAWFDRAGLPPASEAAVLRHEQGHFDLTELTAREMAGNATRIATEMETAINADPAKHRRMVDLIRATGSTTARAEASRQRMQLLEAASPTLQRLLAQEEATQARYEAETGHGIDAARQAEWDAEIRKRLARPFTPAP